MIRACHRSGYIVNLRNNFYTSLHRKRLARHVLINARIASCTNHIENAVGYVDDSRHMHICSLMIIK